MAGTVTVNVSGKLEINFDFSITFSSDTASDEVRSILRPIDCPTNLALTEISDPGNAQLDLPAITNGNIDESEVFESLTAILSSMARPSEEINSSPSTEPPTPTDSFSCPSLSVLDTDWLPTPPEYFGANWLDSPVRADVFSPRVVESIANAFNGILAELDSSGNDSVADDDNDGNGDVDGGDDGHAGFIDDGDVVFLFEVVRT